MFNPNLNKFGLVVYALDFESHNHNNIRRVVGLQYEKVINMLNGFLRSCNVSI